MIPKAQRIEFTRNGAIRAISTPRSMEASLTEDLQADSLDAVELNMAFEDKFGITIADEDLGTLKTVGDIFNYLVARAA